MDWRVYVAMRAAVNRLPFGAGLRALKRRIAGYEPDPGNLETTLADLAWMQAEWTAAGGAVQGKAVLEIGSGWFPTIPTLLAVQGAARVHMTDLNPHMDDHTFASTLAFLKHRFPDDQGLQRVGRLADLPLDYLAPFDPAALPDASLGLVTSRTVLEHIEPDELVRLFSRLRPKIARDGLMVHLVDHSDHMAHRDPSLSLVNFLQWSPGFHRWVNRLTQEGENRLRHQQYAPIFEAAGFKVVSTSNRQHAPTLKRLPSMKLAPPFQQMAAEDLSVYASVYVVRPAA